MERGSGMRDTILALNIVNVSVNELRFFFFFVVVV